MSRAPEASISAAGTTVTVAGTSSTRRAVRVAVLVIGGNAVAALAAEAAGAGGAGVAGVEESGVWAAG
ncbi:MAG: hypothetical protein Fur0014_13840 [Rubrivivax sp.]